MPFDFRIGMTAFFVDGTSAKIIEIDPDKMGYLKFDRPVGSSDDPTRWGFYDETGKSNNYHAPDIEDAYFEFKRGLNLRFANGRNSRIRRVISISEEDGSAVLELCRPAEYGGEKIITVKADDSMIESSRWFLPKVLYKNAYLVFEDGSRTKILETTELDGANFTLVPTERGVVNLDTYGRVYDDNNFVFEVEF